MVTAPLATGTAMPLLSLRMLGAGEFGFEFDAQAVINGGDDFGGSNGALGGVGAFVIALADDSAALHAAAGEINRPALRPVVAAAGGVDAGGTAEFGEVADHSFG